MKYIKDGVVEFDDKRPMWKIYLGRGFFTLDEAGELLAALDRVLSAIKKEEA